MSHRLLDVIQVFEAGLDESRQAFAAWLQGRIVDTRRRVRARAWLRLRLRLRVVDDHRLRRRWGPHSGLRGRVHDEGNNLRRPSLFFNLSRKVGDLAEELVHHLLLGLDGFLQ